jgi:3-oxoacyl-[acyl-carrier-protein] synthase-3
VKAHIAAIEYALAEGVLTNEQLAADHPDWKVEKIGAVTGFQARRIAGPREYTSTIAARAATKLFDVHEIDRASVDYLILCTQSPDFALPTTACLVQAELGLRSDIGAIDINLGCSGYVYALGLAKGLIESGQVNTVLVLSAETHSKLSNPDDKSTRPIFGDAAAATLVVAGEKEASLTGFVLGTDGRGGPSLLVPNGGMRPGESFSPSSSVKDRALVSNGYDMYMDGLEIFNFTLREVPQCVDSVLEKAGIGHDDIDLYVFHQANLYLIEHLRKKLDIPPEKFVVSLREYGNTGSSTIAIALADAISAGRVVAGTRIMLVGFGVGLSWGGVVATW